MTAATAATAAGEERDGGVTIARASIPTCGQLRPDATGSPGRLRAVVEVRAAVRAAVVDRDEVPEVPEVEGTVAEGATMETSGSICAR